MSPEVAQQVVLAVTLAGAVVGFFFLTLVKISSRPRGGLRDREAVWTIVRTIFHIAR